MKYYLLDEYNKNSIIVSQSSESIIFTKYINDLEFESAALFFDKKIFLRYVKNYIDNYTIDDYDNINVEDAISIILKINYTNSEFIKNGIMKTLNNFFSETMIYKFIGE